MRLAVDVGGTFTDLVVEDSAGPQVYKTATIPDDPVRGVLNVIGIAAKDKGLTAADLLRQSEQFLHATTRATNAVLVGSTARTAYLTTQGHPDVLLFREGGRLGLFDYTRPFPQPYVPRSLTFEVPERITSAGDVHEALDEIAVLRIIDRMQRIDIEAVAVCLLWSVINPVHELRIGEMLEEHLKGVPYTLSHRLNPTVREYRRASSTAIDASLKPLMSDYIKNVAAQLKAAGFAGRLLMVSSIGGMLNAEAVAQAPIHSVKSGPSMAPVAGRHYAALDAKARDVIVADAGGTSYDVSLVHEGRLPTTHETWLGPEYHGHMTGFASVDVQSIGAGGGSIAWVDQGGLLHVGPESAGAVPGPVCYGRGGTRPTVTDAALVLGYLDPDYFLGGSMALDVEAARAVIQRDVAAKLGLDLLAGAEAVFRLVTEHMVSAIEEITLNQGLDPRNTVLVGGGGAAGMNSVAIARRIGCRQVIIPSVGAALSAAGALMSELRSDYSSTFFTSTDRFDCRHVTELLGDLEARCRDFAAGPGAGSTESVVEFFAEARYPHQIWELELPLRGSLFETQDHVEQLRRDFHENHRRVFGIDDPDSEVEIVSWRAQVRCRLAGGSIYAAAPMPGEDRRRHGRRPAFFADVGLIDTPIQSLATMRPDTVIDGPVIVESPMTTVVVDPGASVQLTTSGSLLIKPAAQAHASPERAASAASPGTKTAVSIDLDGVQLAVITNRLQGVVRKMINTLLRTGRSGVLNTARDFSCCLVTNSDELLAVGDSLPIHVMIGPDLMSRALRDLHPRLCRGDAFLHNSPYLGNSHAADHVIVVPVVDTEGVHRLTVMVKAHQADCGNSLPSTYHAAARDVYEEGALIFPMVRIQENYRDCEDIIRMCKARIRVPEQWHGDYLAMIGAARIGELAILELGEELGWDLLNAYIRKWFDYSEHRMAEVVSKLPAGKVTTQSVHDPFPGAPDGIPVNVTVEVRPGEGLIDVDLRDNIDCLPCGLNLTEATAHSAALIGIFNSIEPTIPTNAGAFRRARIHLRDNCIVGRPRHPYSCSAATTNLTMCIANTVQRAIAELGPDLGMAECGRTMPPAWAVISGFDHRRDNARFVNQIFLAVTGGAGAPRCDAWLTQGSIVSGGQLRHDSVEIDEIHHPMLVHSQRIVPDTEGAGRFRGAPGAYVEYGPLGNEMQVTWVSAGNVNPAQGARGGLAGACSNQFLRGADSQFRQLDAVGSVALRPGQTIVSISSGGGGYGIPWERDPELVRRDVIEGWITRLRAKDVYGVILDDSFSVDQQATIDRRVAMVSQAATRRSRPRRQMTDSSCSSSISRSDSPRSSRNT